MIGTMLQENLPTNLDLNQLSQQEREKVDSIQKNLESMNPRDIISFGQEIQFKISEFSDKVLSEIRNKDSGYTGELLNGLLEKLKDISISPNIIQESKISQIPLLGKLFSKFRSFLSNYESILSQVEKVTNELHKARAQLIQDITLFESLYEKNLEYYNELKLYILAGEEKLKELQTKVLPSLAKNSETTQDPMEIQKYNDTSQAISQLDKKIHDLKLTLALSLQTAPQIRLVQNGNQLLVEKIQSTILNTIPLWKNQMVIAIGLLRQSKALEVQKEVNKTTNEILIKNAELLKSGTLGIAEESEKGIIELETLKKTNQLLLETIQEAIRIQQEGRKKRKEAEKELIKLENDFKNQLKTNIHNANSILE